MNRISSFATALIALAGSVAISTAAQAPPNGQHPWQHGAPPSGAPPNAAPQNGAAPAPGPGLTGHPSTTARIPEPTSAYSTVPVRKTASGEQFFIVASLDLQQHQLLLKYPTEVTLLVKTDDNTKFVDDSGKPLKLSDLRAGDTVWLTSRVGADGAYATKVRKGEMTVADLHNYYLDYAEIK
jgi:hypothetical protein